MKTKAERARELYVRGVTVVEISQRLNMEPTNVRKALKRNSPQDEGKRRKAYGAGVIGGKGEHLHNFVKTWERSLPPRGSCVAWVVEDGKARQCGKPAKRQLCEDCAHKTRTLEAPLSKGVWA